MNSSAGRTGSSPTVRVAKMPAPDQVPNDALRIGYCGPEDREEQARLFNACFKKKLDAAALTWRYDENPHGGAASVVSRPPGGDGVSGYACSPRVAIPYGSAEDAIVVGETGDVMTHPDWRKRGIFSGLDRACMEEIERRDWAFAFGLPNRRSAHIFVELGWEVIGRVRPYTFVLLADEAAREARRVDGRLRTHLLPLARMRGRAARKRLRRLAGGALLVRPLERFPDEVGELSLRVAQRHSFMVRRDADYLQWRFIENTSGRHRAFEVADEDGSFRGYVVIQVPAEGSRLGFLVDVLAEDEAALSAAIEGGLAQLQAAGASAVQATGIDGTRWARDLVRSGFQRPRPENHLIVILHPCVDTHPILDAARDIEGWYFTDGDRDDETMG